MATIDRYYFRVCTEGARRRGVDVHALLAEAGLDPASLDRPGWRGSVEAMALLVRAVWRTLDDEFMGHTPAPMPRGGLAFACELALEADSVAEGLRRAARFYNLANPGIRTELESLPDRLAVTVRFARPELDPHHYFSEFWMITWHRLACWLAGETLPLIRAGFDYEKPESYFEEFKYLFPCPHAFRAKARMLEIDGHVLHAPVRRSADELRAMLDVAPLDLMTIPASDHSLQRQVRQLLVRDPALTAAGLAHKLGLPPDLLRRRLRAEGQALSAIREYVRRDRAMRLLATGNRSVETIAGDLGYAEARSFTRAFRAWTGQSPSQYRQRH
jgi:AraC-like DNA-binding protein